MAFTQNLKQLLASKDWTVAHLQAALADKGVTISQWSIERWITGECAPRLEIFSAIAAALGVTPNDLLAEPTNEPAACNS